MRSDCVIGSVVLSDQNGRPNRCHEQENPQCRRVRKQSSAVAVFARFQTFAASLNSGEFCFDRSCQHFLPHRSQPEFAEISKFHGSPFCEKDSHLYQIPGSERNPVRRWAREFKIIFRICKFSVGCTLVHAKLINVDYNRLFAPVPKRQFRLSMWLRNG
jgi:hypothetical protein